MIRIYNQWYGLKLKELELAKKMKDYDVINLVGISREMTEIYKIYSIKHIKGEKILECFSQSSKKACILFFSEFQVFKK